MLKMLVDLKLLKTIHWKITKKFLDLYVTYKMKLRNAFIRDYQNDEELIAELDDYKEKVGVSYIEEKQIVSPGMHNFYNQRGEEVRVSHIMLKLHQILIRHLTLQTQFLIASKMEKFLKKWLLNILK